MSLRISNPGKIARIFTICILSFMICWETLLVFFPLKPFWRDEWCIIFNLKFKTASQLWGPLDYTQQFPRVYLELLKWFCSKLNYSYFSFRLPSFIVGIAAIVLCWNLMKRIYPPNTANRFLFVLILVSFRVFMDYFVQIKQYEAELLLSLLALWQLLELADIFKSEELHLRRYVLLCLSFTVATFFSYTYPIVVAPVFIVIFIQGLLGLIDKQRRPRLWLNLFLQWLPLLLCIGSIGVFYIIDIRQLMADHNMHNYWERRLMPDGLTFSSFFIHLWLLFAHVGSGVLFEVIFGILGVLSLAYNLSARHIPLSSNGKWSTVDLVRLYSLVLIFVAIGLFIADKLPMGEPKFNSFMVPAISVLIIYCLDQLFARFQYRKYINGFVFVLFVSLGGNVIMGFVNNFMSAEYLKRIQIYAATERAIRLATTDKIPILITPDIGFPDNIADPVPFLSMVAPSGVLKTFPAYQVGDTVAIFDIKNLKQIDSAQSLLPVGSISVLIGDGLNYRVIRR